MQLRFWKAVAHRARSSRSASRAWNWKTAAAVGVAGALGGLAYGGVRAARRWYPQTP